ncbi:VCBS repeat domain-containing M23 family metallopeptidase [Psychromicrobium lacuslunae]|uniref:M23ase beta-sheet core domain-containing protein n=1 Tax=Psychromicrobium lacuslunae TaxID=1618207 RepID=A0A0D4BY63_9MICC|nr:VCBS repeat domain-containing M23 family metallopeptidase [Psychromicrobium lacuslunae]AJT41407.1 hypothetical protein UM93_07555 [Psychromicrobium lacuslunae]
MKKAHWKLLAAIPVVSFFLLGLGTQQAAADPLLYLPFPAGQTHTITQYPHGGDQYNGYAMDIGMPLNNSILASAAGTVVTAGSVNNASTAVNGNQVIIDHGGNFCTQYNHLNWVNVSVGQSVGRGALLGGAGSTGTAYGVHLHWNTIYCSTLTTRGALHTAEYPGGFSNGMSITSQNSGGGPTIGDAGSLVAINPSGQLVNYGAKLPLVSPPNLIGPGWADFKSVHVTDWNNDGVLDLLAQANGGNLTIYYGSSNGGFNNPLQIGHGWANLDIQIAKFDGPNTYPGIIAKTNTGALLFYPNLGSNKIGNPRTIGSGWNNISDFTTLDWNNDGATDVIGIQASTGDLIAYVKNGGNTFESQKIGQGWTGIRIQAITSFNGTGTKGLLATKTDGTLHYYPITGTTFGTPSQIGNGWNTMKIAGH